MVTKITVLSHSQIYSKHSLLLGLLVVWKLDPFRWSIGSSSMIRWSLRSFNPSSFFQRSDKYHMWLSQCIYWYIYIYLYIYHIYIMCIYIYHIYTYHIHIYTYTHIHIQSLYHVYIYLTITQRSYLFCGFFPIPPGLIIAKMAREAGGRPLVWSEVNGDFHGNG